MENTQVKLHPPNSSRQPPYQNPLPPLIQTPSGLALLELQGSFRLPESAGRHGSSEQVRIGKIHFPDYTPDSTDEKWMKKVHMYVDRGMRLTGEVKKLPKAIAVVRKKEGQPQDSDEVLEVMEIVKYKLDFSDRPEPIGMGQ